jgi:hypothetical protein
MLIEIFKILLQNLIRQSHASLKLLHQVH